MSRTILRQGKPPPDVVEVEGANLLLVGREVHHGVIEQRQRPLHALVRLRRGNLDELRRDVDDLHTEILCRVDTFQQVAPPHNHAVAGSKCEDLVIVCKGTAPLMAVGMQQIIGKISLASPLKRGG